MTDYLVRQSVQYLAAHPKQLDMEEVASSWLSGFIRCVTAMAEASSDTRLSFDTRMEMFRDCQEAINAILDREQQD